MSLESNVLSGDFFHLFVYGSLKEGGFLYPKLRPFIVKPLGTAFCKGELYKSSYGNWPVLLMKDRGRVQGELYLVRQDCQGLLFEEEVEAGYDILNIEIECNNKSISAYCCVWNKEVNEKNHIPEGIWVV